MFGKRRAFLRLEGVRNQSPLNSIETALRDLLALKEHLFPYSRNCRPPCSSAILDLENEIYALPHPPIANWKHKSKLVTTLTIIIRSLLGMTYVLSIQALDEKTK